jgi:hypothetical protein
MLKCMNTNMNVDMDIDMDTGADIDKDMYMDMNMDTVRGYTFSTELPIKRRCWLILRMINQ